MAAFKVDEVHYHYNKTSGKLEVWCFNDEKAYAEKYRKRMMKYDFGRKPNDETGAPTDKKIKLMVGVYREPYRDGWKYTIFKNIHPMMVDTVLEYIHYGLKPNEDGEMEPFTYLRHNRKALGIHYLFERYLEVYKVCQAIPEVVGGKDIYKIDLVDFFHEPYFPSPQNYTGRNLARAKED